MARGGPGAHWDVVVPNRNVIYGPDRDGMCWSRTAVGRGGPGPQWDVVVPEPGP